MGMHKETSFGAISDFDTLTMSIFSYSSADIESNLHQKCTADDKEYLLDYPAVSFPF